MIYFTGDTHGGHDMSKLSNRTIKAQGKILTKDDNGEGWCKYKREWCNHSTDCSFARKTYSADQIGHLTPYEHIHVSNELRE